MNWWTLGFILCDVVLLLTAKHFLNIQIHPYFYISIISLIVSAELLIYIKLFKKTDKNFFKLSNIKTIIPSGLLIGMASAVGFLSIKLTSATNFALLNKTTILISPVFAWLILKESINILIFPIILVVLFGIWLLTGDLKMIINLSGDSLAIITTFFVALDYVYQKKATTKNSDLTVAFWRRFISALILTILWLLTPQFGKATINFLPWLFLISFGYFLVSIFMVKAVKSQPIADFNLYINITPVIVAVMAFFLLGEKLNLIQWLGAGLILTAIMSYNLLIKYDSRNNSGSQRVKVN